MDKLRAAVAQVTARARGSRPTGSSRAPAVDHGQRGQGLAEYALILAGIAVVAIASLVFLGGNISDLFWAPINEEFAAVLSMLGI